MQNQGMSSIQDIVNQRNADTTNQMQYLRGGAPGGVAAPSPASAPQASADVPTGGAGGSLPAEYLPYYQEASARTGIPVNVLIAQGKQESNFNPNATGGAGEIGLHQILPATAQSPGFGMAGVDPATLRDPRANINFAADYLKARGGPRTDFSNPANVEAALKNYNGGGDPNYVQHVMRYAGGVPVVSGGQGVAGRTGGTDVAGPAAPGAPGVNPNAQVQIPPPSSGQTAGAPGGAAPQQYTRQQALDMMQRSIDVMSNPRNQYNPALMKGAQAQMELAKTLLGLDTFRVDPRTGVQTNQNTGAQTSAATPMPRYTIGAGGIQTEQNTGEQKSAATPLLDYRINPSTGVYEARGGKPIIPPTGRPIIDPGGSLHVINPGGTVTTPVPADNPAVAARASAGAQGTKTGEAAVATLGKMASLGSEADNAIGNIDYGVNQLHEAAKGGIPAGYFAPWLATAAAAGKSLGVDLGTLGIDPNAVGNIQSAQKTLGVVAGTILQNAIGKDSAITDAKIEHFIHTQPGIATDPNAIERVLGWARSQFTYNRDMAMHAMHNVNPDTGMLPPGWQAQFYKEKGAFAPIYDPLSQEMKQPAGQGPAPEMPKGSPQTGPQPPVPGARLAPDKNWYVPDPARPGKYLQVKPGG
jgi:hypothetical protein